VLEDGPEDRHEFVELHNPGAAAVSLAGWKLAGDVSFTFPPGASIAPGGFVVVAKRKADLLAIARYELAPIEARVFGDYAGELDNGKGAVVLLDAGGRTVEQVAYDDAFPWPIAADAFGAGESWFTRPADRTVPLKEGDPRVPFERHRFMGHSLERASFTIAAQEVANWVPSPLDGATPGRRNAAAGEPPAVVVELAARAQARPDDHRIGAGEKVAVRAKLSAVGRVANLELEHFVDFREGRKVTPPAPRRTALAAAGGALEAVLDAEPASSVVRYRVWGRRPDGRVEVLSPRPTDPHGWHAYFVNPQARSPERTYHIFVTPADWLAMWNNIRYYRAVDPAAGAAAALPTRTARERSKGGGRYGFCQPNPTWDHRVPAVFVHDGKVYDVRARYQGSRYGRQFGVPFKDRWEFPAPEAGRATLAQHDRFAVYSWSLAFPAFNDFEGDRRRLILNKLAEACPGLNHLVAARLLESAGLAASRGRYARVNVNGGYYHYMLDIETPDEAMLRRIHGRGKPLGDLFKAQGAAFSEGPWGISDMRRLSDQEYAVTDPASDPDSVCGPHQDRHRRYGGAARYAATYARRTHDWKGPPVEVQRLIADLHDARGNTDDVPADRVPALRRFFQDNFDVDTLLTYRAVMNWMAPGDDFFLNYFLYRRPGDGKWTLIPWDFDLMFGGWQWAAGMDASRNASWEAGDTQATASFHIGERRDRSNRAAYWNHLTDAFLKAFPDELHRRLTELSAPGKPLHADSVKRLVDEARALFRDADASASPADFFSGDGCLGPAAPGSTTRPRRTADEIAAAAKAFAEQRHRRVLEGRWR
jgi:hypothetical protein